MGFKARNTATLKQAKTAYKKHGTIRAAAEALGIPKSTLADLLARG